MIATGSVSGSASLGFAPLAGKEVPIHSVLPRGPWTARQDHARKRSILASKRKTALLRLRTDFWQDANQSTSS